MKSKWREPGLQLKYLVPKCMLSTDMTPSSGLTRTRPLEEPIWQSAESITVHTQQVA